ncbi:MAG: nicotinamide mononucleotide transporter [Bacteroidales bacterium]|nr:nicotinamide mononucleotide transporter [Bacteroidales bacterium]
MLTDPIHILGAPTSILEIFAVLCGLASVWFMKKENILVYPLGIINVLIYVYICFISKLYAYAGINVFYAVMSAYGWYNWLRKNEKDEQIYISRLKLPGILLYAALIIAFFSLLQFLLDRYTDSEIPSWDALTTSIYIIAMWLLAQKKIEHWLLWIAGDIISIGMFIWLNLYFSAFQFVVFTVIAVFGFVEWRKKYEGRGTKDEGRNR